MSDGGAGRGYRLKDLEHAMRTFDKVRIDQGIGIGELADLVEVTRNSVAAWLTGMKRPIANRLFDFAGALGYDIVLIPRRGADGPRPTVPSRRPGR